MRRDVRLGHSGGLDNVKTICKTTCADLCRIFTSTLYLAPSLGRGWIFEKNLFWRDSRLCLQHYETSTYKRSRGPPGPTSHWWPRGLLEFVLRVRHSRKFSLAQVNTITRVDTITQANTITWASTTTVANTIIQANTITRTNTITGTNTITQGTG